MKNAFPSTKQCTWIWVALVILHLIILGSAQFNLHQGNTPLVLTLAVLQTALVMLWYMGVRHNTKTIWIFSVAGFFWLLLQWTLTLSDYLTRGFH